MEKKKDRFFVLRIRSFRENDAVVSLFGEHFGKKSFLLRGIKKTASRLGGICTPLAFLEGEYAEGKGDWGRLCSAVLLEPPPGEPGERFFFLNLLDQVTPEGEVNALLFLLLKNLAMSSLRKSAALFFLKVLALSGCLPDFRFCIRCGKKFSEKAFWSDGGITCPLCVHSGNCFSFPEIKLLSFWQRASFEEGKRILVSPEREEHIFRFLWNCAQRAGIALSLKTLPSLFPERPSLWKMS